MKRTFEQNLVEELKGRIATHHTLIETIENLRMNEDLYNGVGGELFVELRYKGYEALEENGEVIDQILTSLYNEWSGLDDARVNYIGRALREDELDEMWGIEEDIYNEHAAVAGEINFFDIGEDRGYGLQLPKDFIIALNEINPFFKIEDSTLGIL